MHVILVPYGSSGDVHPFLGIGRALKERGHRVTVLSIEHFGPLVRELGFEHAVFGEDLKKYEEVLRDPDLWHPSRSLKLICKSVVSVMRPIFELIQTLHEPGETVLVFGTLAIGARIAEEALKIPSATVHLQPIAFRSTIEMPELPGLAIVSRLPRFGKSLVYRFADSVVIDRHIAAEVNAFRAELGLGRVRGILGDYTHSPHRVIGLFPDWFAAPQADWPPQARLTGFPLYDEADVAPLSPELEEFLAEGDPPVVVGFGSAMTQAGPQFEAAAKALGRLGKRGIFLTKFPEQILGSLPGGVRHFEYAPFSLLLPRCSALVHHGGIGTLAQGIAAGVPQLISPLAFDQFDNAARLRKLGLGMTLPRKQFVAVGVAETLGKLLEDRRIPENCREMTARVREGDPLGATCRLIEGLRPEAATIR